MISRRLLSLLSLLLLVQGCGSPFPPRTLVERLRVLGIRADPADADLQNTITLSALVADPTGNGRALTTTWAVCAPGINFETFASDCPSDTSYPVPSGEPLSTGEPTALLVMPDLVTWIGQQGYTIDTSTAQVVDIWIGFVVSADGDEVRALKRLPVHIFPEAAPPPENTYNQNPKLAGLYDISISSNNIPVDNPISLTLGKNKKFKPAMADNTRETFTPSGETERQEDFVFSWFSTIGEFDYLRTISAADNQDSTLDENVWIIPEGLTEDQKANSTLWVVVRDGRFGTDWMRFEADIK